VAETPLPLPAFTSWDTFPFEGDLKVKALDAPVDVEPARSGEEIADCKACQSADDSYIWVNERWRVRSMDRPTGLPMILILEPRSHLDLGDLPNLLAAELGVMTVRIERAIRSLDNVARVHTNRWGDGAAHLHIWFMARPKGQLQLRGSFLPMWDDILPPVDERGWREDLALVAAWLAEFGGTALAQPPRIEWQAPSSFLEGLGVLPTEETEEPLAAETQKAAVAQRATEAETAAEAQKVERAVAPAGTKNAEGPAVRRPESESSADKPVPIGPAVGVAPVPRQPQ
jgi:diadenosine tetraphosphate (Ap4A) HIT family hydrolase